MIRRLLPWQANLGKRLVKTPKIYFRDYGLLHTLCDIPSAAELLINPKLGASWEGFALKEIIQTQQPEQSAITARRSACPPVNEIRQLMFRLLYGITPSSLLLARARITF